jgi:hypothetical protein
MPSNYVLLRKVTLSTSAASVTFSSIPTTGYTDLKLVWSSRSSADNLDMGIAFNGSGASSSRILWVTTGGSVISEANNYAYYVMNPSGSTANTFSNGELYIPNYTSSINKSFSVDMATENNASTGTRFGIEAGLITSTTAISSIAISPNAGNFVANSEFSLYGIAAVGTEPVISPFATGGDSVTNDGTYWIHTFLSSGTFTPGKNLTCDYLVVAGGGGMGVSGAGAGGLRSTVTATGGGGSLESPLSLTSSTAYPVIIGAGGAGSPDGQIAMGSQGSNSIFHNIVSLGGGRGSKDIGPSRSDGISGGSGSGGFVGGALTNPGVGQGGSGTTGQGYAGGNSGPHADATSSGGGGGGAGAVGGTPSTANTNAPGGNGVAVSITGSSVTYAGGGGSGIYGNGTAAAGGTGGGGAGATGNAAGSSGTPNTGGGAGAAYSEAYRYAAYSGGSGVVIIRYPMV